MALTNYDKGSLILPMDGSNGGATFTDWSLNTKIVTANGNAQTSTAQSKYYGSSGYFNAANFSCLTIPSYTDLNLSTNNFTIGYWFRRLGDHQQYARYFTSKSGDVFGGITVISSGLTASNDLGLYMSSAGSSYDIIGQTIYSSIAIDTWYFFAITRSGVNFYIFLDGTQIYTFTSSASIYFNSADTFCIGGQSTTTSRSTNSNMQDFFIINGEALWTSAFTPPTRLIGEITGNVKDINGANASRIITACPRTNPTRSFSTISDAGTGNYTLRVPATEVSRIALADEVTLYNDIVDRIIPE